MSSSPRLFKPSKVGVIVRLSNFFRVLLIADPFVMVARVGNRPIVIVMVAVVVAYGDQVQLMAVKGPNEIPVGIRSQLCLPIRRFSMLLLPKGLVREGAAKCRN